MVEEGGRADSEGNGGTNWRSNAGKKEGIWTGEIRISKDDGEYLEKGGMVL